MRRSRSHRSEEPEPWEREREASEIAEAAATYDAGWPPPAAMSSEIARLVFDGLEDLERQYSDLGRSLADVGEAEDLAQQMLAAVPAPSPWGELGPFYGSSRVSQLLGGISRQAVADRRGRGTLLGLKTADGAWVYPAFQFDERHKVLAGLSDVLKILQASSIDDWSLAGWLTSPMRSLDGLSPIDWLRTGKDSGKLRSLAAEAGQRFAQ